MLPSNYEHNEGQPFSMDIATLIRIDNALKMLSTFQKVRHRRAVVRHLKELHKEVYPFLKAEERLTATAYIQTIDQNIGKPGCWDLMDAFDYWLRDQLYITGLLMHKAQDPGLAVYRGLG